MHVDCDIIIGNNSATIKSDISFDMLFCTLEVRLDIIQAFQ